MTQEELTEIANYVVVQGSKALNERAPGEETELDYVALFARDEVEFEDMASCASQLGEETDLAMGKTGRTFKLYLPFTTDVGNIPYLKIRKPDQTRPQRGAPDFVVKDYLQFKARYLGSSGNFTLMPHRNGEMVELKGVDVLVYIKNEPFMS
jgi:hypothetical protein